MRKFFLILTMFMIQPLKLFVYRRIYGWNIGHTVKIGFSYIDADDVLIGDGVRIGNFNIIRNLRHLQVDTGSFIANFNQFYGNKYQDPQWKTCLIIRDHVLFMSHHFIDVAGTIEIGSKTVVGGRDTHFWSHSLVSENDSSKLVPLDIFIGKNVYIGARATLLGCSIPDAAIIGMGSVVTKSFSAEDCQLLIAGNPAMIKKRYSTANNSELLVAASDN